MEHIKDGRRTNVTVLFTDMKGFTSTSEQMDPEDIDELMNDIFSKFSKIIETYGGEVEKYIGDAMVAVFGAKKSYEDNASRAINSAYEFLYNIKDLNNSKKYKDIDIAFRTGIHSGLVTTGKRGDYDVITGHTMAVSSRLQTAAKPNTILVSQETMLKAEKDFLFEKPIDLSLKGKDYSVKAYEVLGRNFSFKKYDTTFIRRDNYINQILKQYLKFNGESNKGFYLYGSAGLGKTRILSEFIETTKKLPNFNSPIFFTTCSLSFSNKYQTIFNLLFSYFNIDEKGTNLEKNIHNKCIDLDCDEELITKFIKISKKYLNREYFEKKEIDNILERIFKLIIENNNSIYQALIVIDNVNRIDKESRDFFRYYINNDFIKPFILIADRFILEKIDNLFLEINTLEIEPLNNEESKQLIKNILNDKEPSKEIINQIIEKSKGNPLFLEQFSLYIDEFENIEAIPTSIQNMILSTIDKFSKEERYLFEVISINKTGIKRGALIRIIDSTKPEYDIYNLIEKIDNNSLITIKNGIYKFNHDLYREAIYSSILIRNKKILHKHYANWCLEFDNIKPLDLIPHLIKAEMYKESAKTIYNSITISSLRIIDYIDKTLENTDDITTQMKLLKRKYEVYYQNGKYYKLIKIAHNILELSMETNNPDDLAESNILMSNFHLSVYDYYHASFFAKKALFYNKIANNDKKNISKSNILKHLATSELYLNKIKNSYKYFESIEENLYYKLVLKYDGLSEFYERTGEYTKAIKLLRKLFYKSKEVNLKPPEFLILRLLKIYKDIFNYEMMEELIEESLKYELSSHSGKSKLYAWLSFINIYKKNEQNFSDYIDKSIYYTIQINNIYTKTYSLTLISEIFLQKNDLENSYKYSSESLKLTMKHNNHYLSFKNLMILCEIFMKNNKEYKIENFLNEATFIIELNQILDKKDIILYHYFVYHYKQLSSNKKRKHLYKSVNLLKEELAIINERKLVSRYLNSRMFEKIFNDDSKINSKKPNS